MITGAVLVLVTWLLAVACLMLAGLRLGAIGAKTRADALRRSMWWGLALATIAILALSLAMPLGTGTALAAVLALCLVGGVIGLPAFWRLAAWGGAPGRRIGWLLPSALVLAIGYLAFAALGPVTNYDSGLYHLGAIRYQQEFGLIPGIANLYFPLGYGNSVVPLSAFLGSTPWGLDGFRLFNGLLLTMLAVETALRWRQGLRTPGTFLLGTAQVFVWIPMVGLSDYWVTSPTSDTSVLVLTTVAVAYLADALTRRGRSINRWTDASVALVVAWILISMRPTMAVFAIAALAVVVALLIRSARSTALGPSGRQSARWVLVLGVVCSGALVVAMQAARDRVLSGWWQYPLSILAFDVPWRASDPVGFRTATLGAARDPNDLWAAAENWAWIPGWLGRLPTQWEFVLAVLLALLSAGLVLAAVAAVWGAARPLRTRALVLACTPSGVAVLAWFIASPPAFRFVWGPLFTLAALPGAFALAAMRDARGRWLHWVVAGFSLVLMCVIAFSAVFRFDATLISDGRSLSLGHLTLGYRVASIPAPPIAEGVLPSGLEIVSPVDSDQCWAVYPMCTAQIEPTVELIGPTLADGFRR